jgi:hypothetical protein
MTPIKRRVRAQGTAQGKHVAMTIAFDPELFERVADLALGEQRSFGCIVRRLLSEALQKQSPLSGMSGDHLAAPANLPAITPAARQAVAAPQAGGANHGNHTAALPIDESRQRTAQSPPVPATSAAASVSRETHSVERGHPWQSPTRRRAKGALSPPAPVSATDIEQFLAAGGKITKCPTRIDAELVFNPATKLYRRE